MTSTCMPIDEMKEDDWVTLFVCYQSKGKEISWHKILPYHYYYSMSQLHTV